jgi:DNA-binding transcriptional LysR family regulator
MELTIQGRALVQQAQPLLNRIEALAVSLDNPGAATGIIRMGVGEIVALTWFGQLIARLKREMPHVNYEIEVGLTVDMLHKLELAKLDIAILAAPIVNERIETTGLGSVTARWFITPRLRREFAKRRATLREIFETMPIWSVSRPSRMNPMAMETLRRYGISTNKMDTSDNLGSIVQLVASGAGIAFLPDSLVSGLIRKRQLTPLSAELPAESLEFAIACHKDNDQAIVRHIIARAFEASTFSARPARRNSH